MGRRIGIALSESSSEDERAMVLNTSLMNIQRFLLILDDVWTRIELAKLGVCRWTGGYGWKVVLSTRIEQVTRSVRADRTIKMKPVCEEESWALFSTGAFGDGQPVSQEIERIAKEVADESQGLPLALNVISAAMAKQTDRSQWDVALKHLKTVDDTIYSIHQDIDRDLYKQLRLSYNALRDDLKLCFLYCAFYPEDKGIHVEELIKMWRAEGLVKSREPGNINEIGHAFLKVLIDRCLIEVECENSLTREVQYCRMHDVIRDMAIRIGDEEKCLLRAGQNVKTFPLEVMDGCERISLMSNNIESLPDNFVCPSLLSLVLSCNKGIKAVPHGFLINLRSLKVLDLSHTGLRSLPSSVGRLKHLVYLGLMNTQIQQLPEDIGELGGLELLDLSYCHDLQYLPVRMGDLKCLKLLNLFSCYNLSFLPRGISQLSLLENLYIFKCEAVAEQMGLEHGPGENAACLNDLRNLTNLRTLQLNVQGSIPAGVMGNWAEMQDLALRLEGVLPEDMRSMKFLKSLILDLGDVIELPEWLGDFNNLQSLDLRGCCRLRDISAVGRIPRLSHLRLLLCAELRELGVRLWTAGSCPMLEELELWHLPSLQNLISPGTTVQEDSMPKLRTLRRVHCDNLKRLPIGLHKLKSIEVLEGTGMCWRGLIWEDDEAHECMGNHLNSIYTSMNV